MARKRPHVEEDLLPIFGHPLRRTLLKFCLEATEPVSPKRLSELTDHPLSNVSYHVRVLAKSGAIEIVAERPVRGSTEHFYEVAPLVKATPWVQAALGLPAKD